MPRESLAHLTPLPLVPWGRPPKTAYDSRPLRLLIVGAVDQSATARWVQALAETGWDVHLFPSHRGVAHPDLESVTVYASQSKAKDPEAREVRLVGDVPWASPFEEAWRRVPNVDRYFRKLWSSNAPLPRLPSWDHVGHLVHLIRVTKPDVIHALDVDSACHVLLEAKVRAQAESIPFPPWILSSREGDALKVEEADLRAVLNDCELHVCGSQRDAKLVRELGFRGPELLIPRLSARGSLDLERCCRLRHAGQPSARRALVLQDATQPGTSSQHWASRVLFGLRAIELCRDALKDYRLVILSVSHEAKIASELFQQSTGISVERFSVPSHEEVVRALGQARLSIELNVSDTAGSSLLEAMTMGALPLLSRLSDAAEWIEEGKAALLVHPEDPTAIAQAIRRAIADDGLVDRAAELNAASVTDLLDPSQWSSRIRGLYETAAARSAPGPTS